MKVVGNYNAILFNLGRIEGDGEVDSDEDSDESSNGEDSSDDDDQNVIYVIDQDRNAVRNKGQQEREKLLRAMKD